MIQTMSSHEYKGGCHCQAIRYQIKLDQSIGSRKITLCNCSICEKFGYLHLIIPKLQFKLGSDWDLLENYQFNKKIAKHYFCKKCGVKSFYQPRSHPDCWSINVRCIDNFSQLKLRVNNFDGKNWQQNIETIR